MKLLSPQVLLCSGPDPRRENRRLGKPRRNAPLAVEERDIHPGHSAAARRGRRPEVHAHTQRHHHRVGQGTRGRRIRQSAVQQSGHRRMDPHLRCSGQPRENVGLAFRCPTACIDDTQVVGDKERRSGRRPLCGHLFRTWHAGGPAGDDSELASRRSTTPRLKITSLNRNPRLPVRTTSCRSFENAPYASLVQAGTLCNCPGWTLGQRQSKTLW
jgi:hypothetical protein